MVQPLYPQSHRTRFNVHLFVILQHRVAQQNIVILYDTHEKVSFMSAEDEVRSRPVWSDPDISIYSTLYKCVYSLAECQSGGKQKHTPIFISRNTNKEAEINVFSCFFL